MESGCIYIRCASSADTVRRTRGGGKGDFVKHKREEARLHLLGRASRCVGVYGMGALDCVVSVLRSFACLLHLSDSLSVHPVLRLGAYVIGLLIGWGVSFLPTFQEGKNKPPARKEREDWRM